MDELKPKRRPFQFSLRKALLWTAVWSVYLGILRSLSWAPIAVGLTIYLAVLLVIRVKYGYERGVLIAIRMTGVPVVCLGVGVIIWSFTTGGSDKGVPVTVYTIILCTFGIYLGFYAFLFVDALMGFVDWIDNLMNPQDH